MKIIPKLQQGGFASLFADYTPLQPSSSKVSTADTKATTKGNDGKLTEKELFDLIKDVDGLPNDMELLANNLYTMFTSVSYTGSKDLARVYMKNLVQLKNNKFNKEEFNKARDVAKEKDGLNEVAITNGGQLIARNRNTNEIKYISLDEANKYKNKNYQILTNSELLWLRANSPKLANNNTVLQTVENAIGMEYVNKLIKSALTDLGTSEYKESGSSSISAPQKAGAEILQQLAAQGQTEGYTTYKQAVTQSKLTKTQQQQANAALDYILQVLPENAKNLLRFKAGSNKGVISLIGNLIISKVSDTINIENKSEVEWDYHSTKSKDGSGDGDDISKYKFNTATNWLAGRGAFSKFVINPGGIDNYVVNSVGLQLTDINNKPLQGNVTLQDAVYGGYSGILNNGQFATMGGKKIKASMLDKILLQGNMTYSIDFPVLDDGVTPDFRDNSLAKINKIRDDLKEKGIDLNSQESIREHYDVVVEAFRNEQIRNPYGPNGAVVDRKWKRFAVMNAHADENALVEGNENPLLVTKVSDDDEADNLRDKIQKQYPTYANTDFVEGTIWIPVNESYIAAATGTGDRLKSGVSTYLTSEDQMLYNANNNGVSLTEKQPNG